MTLSIFGEADPATTAQLPPIDGESRNGFGGDDPDVPRRIDPGKPPGDRAFSGVARTIAFFVLVLTGSIGAFLGYQALPTLRTYGIGFFTGTQFNPQLNQVGIGSVLVGTVEVALIALVIGFPLALLTALYISEYAPASWRSTLIAVIDLIAAVPSVLYGLWGFFFLEPHAINIARWLSQHFAWIPLFKVDTDPNAASWSQYAYIGSAFVAGVCVSMMIIPMAAAVMRQVFSQAPIGEREAAYALGATRWGMVRTVVLPFGRGGIIGGTMLGLGRALGETVAVLLIISPTFDLKFKVLSSGTNTVSALIAARFGEATGGQLAALLTAGFVLFVLTLAVNSVAATFVGRSRSGANI